MSKSRKKRKTPKRVLALPDLEQVKSAVLNTLTSKSGQRTYDHAITEVVEWYCSEPRSLNTRSRDRLSQPPLPDLYRFDRVRCNPLLIASLRLSMGKTPH